MGGSLHARRALDWAMREAATRHVALTVLAVNPVMASPWTGNPFPTPGDAATEDRVREAAHEAVAKSAGEIGQAQPASVSARGGPAASRPCGSDLSPPRSSITRPAR
jgi:nucleotide-binding universal stress UspA family protein